MIVALEVVGLLAIGLAFWWAVLSLEAATRVVEDADSVLDHRVYDGDAEEIWRELEAFHRERTRA